VHRKWGSKGVAGEDTWRAECILVRSNRDYDERSAVSILTVWEAKPSSTFVSVFTCDFAENTKVMQRTPTPDRLPGMHGQPLREIMFDSPSM
jgi:hypothetical protein